jgi:hypothetical protein
VNIWISETFAHWTFLEFGFQMINLAYPILYFNKPFVYTVNIWIPEKLGMYLNGSKVS